MSRDYSLESPAKPRRSCGQVVKSKIFIGAVIVCIVVVGLCVGLLVDWESNNDGITTKSGHWNDNNGQLSAEQLFWFDSGLEDIKQALKEKPNTRRAKNVILFVADGMGPSTVTAARIYKDKEEGNLSWERFPHTGLLKVSAGKYTKELYKQNLLFTPTL